MTTVRSLGKLESLLSVGARHSGLDLDDVLSLGRTLLGPPYGESRALRGGRSALNNDGCPMQLCFTATAEGHRARLIVDPAWWHGDPGSRLAASRRVLSDAMRLRGAERLEPLTARLFETVDGGNQALFGHGFIWIGAGLDRPGVAVYLDAGPFGRQGAWEKADWWLGGAAADRVHRLTEELRGHATVASIGCEGTGPGHVIGKLYVRLDHSVRLTRLGVDLLTDPAFAVFLARTVGSQGMNLRGMVLSLGFDLATGKVVDAKIDLCGHCLPLDHTGWTDVLTDVSATLGLRQLPLREELPARSCDVAFAGLGVTAGGRRRLNVYLRPRVEDITVTAESRPDRLRTACHAAADYLCGLQHDTGWWADYQLPVGASTQWVTAFAGLALARTAAATGDAVARSAAEAAARWLLRHRGYPAGWGYNDRTGADAGSTAVAIRLFRALGIRVRREDERWLLGHWRPAGGFATYEGPGCWGDAHPCVTAMAAMALSETDLRGLRGEVAAYVRRTLGPDGTWPAYWWRSHCYSTFHHLTLLRRLGTSGERVAPSPRLVVPAHASAFETAYLAGAAWLRGDTAQADRLLAGLLAGQRFDGSWPGAANLRVTDPDCAKPWETPRGELYVDQRGVMTTSSVLLVLSEMIGGRP